jgi:hypothetical protein
MPLSNDASLNLSFDRADYAAGPGSGPPCGSCQGPLLGQYWKWQQQILCAGCRDRLADTLAASQSAASLGKAALLGGAVALGCGLAYAIFVAVTKTQLALITIGIAFVIAKVVRKASGGIAGRRFQVLAVVLTYLASAMGYAPAVWSGLTSARTTEQSSQTSPDRSDPPTASSKEATSGSSSADTNAKPSAVGLAMAMAILLGITLAAPILAATDAPIGLLIVIFGLWEAWKLSRGLPLAVEGPYQVAPPPTGPPAA